MKRIILMCLLITLTIPIPLLAGVIGPARIRFAEGEIMFRTPDAAEWLPASVNTPLDEGDTIWCPNGSRAEIQLPDGSNVRLDGGSELNLIANEDAFIHLHLASGRLYLRTASNTAKDSLQIDADDTTVLPDARTRLRIDLLPNNQEDVAIFKGSAYVEGNGSRTKVRAGELIALEEGHNEILPLNPPDSWESWNVARDRAQSRSARADSYLPDELKNYSAELDSNGTWTRVPEYGMVWRPSVIGYVDWAPYRSGRWIWRGNDYVWISYETWGWVPYHFGRWAFISGSGWCWVPPLRGDVYWGPGFVGWYNTGSIVGWTPLAPGEIFFGYGHYGRHSVNVAKTTITTRTNIVYRNRHVRGGLTVLPHNDFLRGRTATQPRAGSTSVSVSISVGSPRIKPLRETRMPIVRQTPPKVAPPRIYHQDSRELRQRFQRITRQPGTQQRYQQPAPVVTAPTAPVVAPTAVQQKKLIHPVSVPTEKKTVITPPARDNAPPREVEHQRVTVPQAAPRSAPPAHRDPPQRSEGQQRATSPVTTPQVTAPQRGVKQPRPEQRSSSPVISAPQVTTPQSGGQQSRPVPAVRDQKQKKVWKVTTPEEGKEKDGREQEHKGREKKK